LDTVWELRAFESLDLRRDALFFLIVLPLAALSRDLKTLGSRVVAFSRALEAIDFLNSFTAFLYVFLRRRLKVFFFSPWRKAFLADDVFGIINSISLHLRHCKGLSFASPVFQEVAGRPGFSETDAGDYLNS